MAYVSFTNRHALECNKPCFIHPRSDQRFTNTRWVEMAGSTCDSWSQMGGGGRWLSKHSLPFFVWLYSTLHCEPDQILHENTIRFDCSEMRKVLCPGSINENFPRHPLARPLQQGQGNLVFVQGWLFRESLVTISEAKGCATKDLHTFVYVEAPISNPSLPCKLSTWDNQFRGLAIVRALSRAQALVFTVTIQFACSLFCVPSCIVANVKACALATEGTRSTSTRHACNRDMVFACIKATVHAFI